jgi:hypothetical protein
MAEPFRSALGGSTARQKTAKLVGYPQPAGCPRLDVRTLPFQRAASLLTAFEPDRVRVIHVRHH